MTSLQPSTKAIARAYFDHWTAGRFDEAANLLSEQVTIETPINIYPTKTDFVAALSGFGALVRATHQFVDLGDGQNVVQLYGMDVTGVGTIEMAEHFVIDNGLITQIRQIHDTAALRAAGFDRQAQ